MGDRTVVQSVRIDAAPSPKSADLPSTLTGIPPKYKKSPAELSLGGTSLVLIGFADVLGHCALQAKLVVNPL